MIDADQLERDIDAAPPGSLIGFSEATARELLDELRRGQAAIRSVASMAGASTVAIAAASVRVSGGYSAPNRPIPA